MFFGFQDLSLTNFQENITSVLFTGGCNLHCPYCYNKQLVFPNKLNEIPIENIFQRLEKIQKMITAITITGGEPTIHDEKLITFLKDIKNKFPLLKIKLDTNGILSNIIKKIYDSNLINYLALDLKTIPEFYSKDFSDIDVSQNIYETLKIIRENKKTIDYEIRITIMKDLFNEEVCKKLFDIILPEEKVFIQNFKFFGKENHINLPKNISPKFLSFEKKEVLEILERNSIIQNNKNIFFRNFF